MIISGIPNLSPRATTSTRVESERNMRARLESRPVGSRLLYSRDEMPIGFEGTSLTQPSLSLRGFSTPSERLLAPLLPHGGPRRFLVL